VVAFSRAQNDLSPRSYLSPLFHNAEFVQSARAGIGSGPFRAIQNKIETDALAAGRSFREQADFEPGAAQTRMILEIHGAWLLPGNAEIQL
jgi:hypothetical protein